jgi:hypothetical protein
MRAEAHAGDPQTLQVNAGSMITPEAIAANAGLIHQILAGLQARYDVNAVVTPGKKTDIQIAPKASLAHDAGPLHAEISKQMGMKPAASVSYGDGDLHAFLEKQLGVPPTAGVGYNKQIGDLNISAGATKTRGQRPAGRVDLNYTKQF